MDTNRVENDGWTDYTLSVPDVIRVLGRHVVPLTIGTIGLHLLIWGWPDWSAAEWVRGGLWGCAIYLISVIVHELLHVAVMLYAGVRFREIRAGIRWKEGVAYVHAGRPLSISVYRLILVMPGLVLGLIPALAGLATGSAALTLYAFVMLLSAVGDWAVLLHIRGVPEGAIVEDHPDAVGCRVRVARPPGVA
jgi:hypothetical protein